MRPLAAPVLIALSLFLSASSARAEVQEIDQETMIYVWPKWQRGVSLGARALGRFGAGRNLNAPPGDLMPEASYHIWINHVFEGHVSLGFGVSNGTMEYGLGTKLNLIEFIEDPTKEMMVRGLQRGALASTIKNFMLFLSLDFLHFSYKTPDPAIGQSWADGEFKIIPGAGAQWFFYIPQNWAGKFYVETSLGYTTVSGSNYFLPVLAFGAELL